MSMTIVDLDSETHSRLKKVKQVMKTKNKLFRVNNSVVVNHALKKVEGAKDYEISNTN